MIPAAPDARLPDGFVVRLAPSVRRRPDGALLGGSDAAASGRAMRAMLGMRKFDIAALEAARRAS